MTTRLIAACLPACPRWCRTVTQPSESVMQLLLLRTSAQHHPKVSYILRTRNDPFNVQLLLNSSRLYLVNVRRDGETFLTTTTTAALLIFLYIITIWGLSVVTWCMNADVYLSIGLQRIATKSSSSSSRTAPTGYHNVYYLWSNCVAFNRIHKWRAVRIRLERSCSGSGSGKGGDTPEKREIDVQVSCGVDGWSGGAAKRGFDVECMQCQLNMQFDAYTPMLDTRWQVSLQLEMCAKWGDLWWWRWSPVPIYICT